MPSCYPWLYPALTHLDISFNDNITGECLQRDTISFLLWGSEYINTEYTGFSDDLIRETGYFEDKVADGT
jgi:hypothetical protein